MGSRRYVVTRLWWRGSGPGPRSQIFVGYRTRCPLPGLSNSCGRPRCLRKRASVGLDVHARSVAAAAIDGVTGELLQTRLAPNYDHIRSWIRQLPGPVAVTYEAGPTGFGLARILNADGIRCVVAAPSKLQRPSGDPVLTDAKDAVHLARLLRLDEVTGVVVPSVEQEAARDLVRAGGTAVQI